MKILNQNITNTDLSIGITKISELQSTENFYDDSIIHIVEKGTSKHMTIETFKNKVYEAVQNTFKTEYIDTHNVLCVVQLAVIIGIVHLLVELQCVLVGNLGRNILGLKVLKVNINIWTESLVSHHCLYENIIWWINGLKAVLRETSTTTLEW